MSMKIKISEKKLMIKCFAVNIKSYTLITE